MSDVQGRLRRLLVWLGLLRPEGVHYIGGSDTLPTPLTKEREAELLARMDDEDARKELLYTLWTEFKNIMEFQLVFSLMFLAAGGYLLAMGGVSYQDVNIYRILVLGAFFNAVLQVVYTLLLYLEDQRGALLIAAVFLGANLVLGMGGLWLGEASYGFTFFLSALLACAVAVMRLQHFCQRISYYVFCGRPVFFEAPHGVFSRLAAFLYRDRQERNA